MNITRNTKKYIPENSSTLTHSSSHTSLIISSDLSALSLYNILINNPKLINEKDIKGETFLSYAIKRNKLENFKLLLTSPSLNLNYIDKEGNSYLSLATLYQREEMIIPLINKGININMKNNEGNTALHLAHMLNNKKIIEILNNNEIDFTIENNKGEMAEQIKESITSPKFIENKGIVHYKGSGDLSIHDDNMNNNIYVHKKSNNFNKSKKDIRNIFTESNVIHSSLEKNKISKQRSQKQISKYDDEDNDDFDNINLSLEKKRKNNNSLFNLESTKFNTQIYETNDAKIKDSLNNDFFDLSVDLPKKENKDIVKLDKNINNINKSNNDFDNKKSNYYERPSSSSSEEEEKVKVLTESNNLENENEYDENYNPLDNVEEDNFKIDEDDNNKKKLLSSNKTIDFNFSISHPSIPKPKTNDFDNKNNNNNDNSDKNNNNNIDSINIDNNNSNILINQSKNLTNPISAAPTANYNFGFIIPKVTKNPLPNQSLTTSSLITNINSMSNIQNNSLYRFLEKINMQKYYNNLNSNGFDDIQSIIDQSKNNKIGISDENLKQAGINFPGDRAKILIRIQDLAKNFSFPLPKAIYHICEDLNEIENDIHIKKLNNWLNNINLSSYLSNFISNGYHSVDLILMQMESKFPLTYDILENEIGISLLGHRQRIMNKLIDDARSLKNKLKTKTLVIDNNGTNKICNDCFIF